MIVIKQFKNTLKLSSHRGHAKGFTLIELMIVVAIIGILSAIAMPSYSNYVIKAKRQDAQTALAENAQFMERYFTTNNTYVGAALPNTESPKGSTGAAIQYELDFDTASTATSYKLEAVPANAQASADTTCGDLTLSHTGAQTPSTAGCWR